MTATSQRPVQLGARRRRARRPDASQRSACWAAVIAVLALTWTATQDALTAEGRPCSNACSGHGQCVLSETDGAYCTCVRGFNTSEGPDCSFRECPKDVAWWDFATADDVAHAEVACSNMGVCDETSGQCDCQDGFEGIACERLSCPVTNGKVCMGRGRCMSLREAAETKDDATLFRDTTYTRWDADKIYGCVCDPGFTGYDCSLRTCTEGIDIINGAYLSEIQILDCSCPTNCDGYFYLNFRSQSVKILHSDSDTELKASLESLEAIVSVDVTLYGGSTVCDNDGVSAEITFRNLPGDLPDMIITGDSYLTSDGGATSVSMVTSGSAGSQGGTSRDGTAPVTECSGRGYCNRQFGSCWCQNTNVASTGGLFEASDGEGNAGTRDDCGKITTTPTACPFADNGSGTPTECASQGTCDPSTYRCSCNAGYTGHNCMLLTCPSGPAWFAEPTMSNSVHATAECSNMGICDRETGLCSCKSGFTGNACQLLACPGAEEGNTCNGHGTCYNMQQLAMLSLENGELRGVTYGTVPDEDNWDYNSIQGCYCDDAYFHGPFGWDFSSFSASYDCTKLSCPYGDNPQTTGQVNEVQTMTCIATAGTFQVSFRQDFSADIPYDATVAQFRAYLQALYSINEVAVSFDSGSTVCSSGAGTVSTLSFKVPGDLPLLTADTTQLTGSISFEESVQGTTEFIECSGQGTCDRSTGICDCFPGYSSSDGSGDGVTVGQRGDCGAMLIFASAQDEDAETL
ncbi:Multiple epidermal growth factor-like domains protein 10 [Hondaea fermentalgiana]|uniref:Multiple epidermal growth factor-like domains protein 10 n=1 Tax=Hondaea fermentalgiana TaxID=2315210 RepID=A0A2R5GB99_9STRA|nr:Multiple epidermal growth factor-like domains protein 10 [Hondaea fermentalgiana]|eukprot:GBG28286.1 Multiple epidermal growth factor-like domains protein 10 [Hondaea fermentalgiana]